MNHTQIKPQQNQAQHQIHLRKIVSQLVIQHGYLEQHLDDELCDTRIRTAAASLDAAIDILNLFLEQQAS